MKNALNKTILSVFSLMGLHSQAQAYIYNGCHSDSCKDLLESISGGSATILLLEAIAFIWASLYLVTKIYEKWFK